ncbi:alpha/beta hydrolase [Sphingomonas sp. Y38-1Y]|uniref:alpha/beta fold hydrolase n=1 Tax=Sphingomonas sp. Y38-1Y TaxID=3078265 RepID=UPI0028E9ADA9|nr:alpha/beta hydrolase [Sphingomonas sp. Y38-1Y]
MRIAANGLEFEYAISGPADGPAMLLIIGLGTQMTRWPQGLIDGLVGHGFRVIRFDNRDVGLSSRLDDAGAPDLPAVMAAMLHGGTAPVAYTLADMAEDAIALLRALGVEQAHVVGGSMGGMIAQILAAKHPDAVLSLTSIMSSSGNPALPRASEAALALLSSERPDPADEAAIVERAVIGGETLGSPGYPIDRAVRRVAAIKDYRRGYHPAGIARQTAAIVASGDRRALLRAIKAPTVVIHGTVDPLVPIEAGRDTAANIPGARMIEVAGMGHDLPDALVPEVVDAIVAVASSAATTKVSPTDGLT